jgi:hypothetical protein
VTEPRRFPPPWSVEETDACFIVRDANGQALAYVYFEKEPGAVMGGESAHRDEAAVLITLTAKITLPMPIQDEG